MGTELLDSTSEVAQSVLTGDFNPAIWIIIGFSLACVLWGRRISRMRS